MGRDTRTYITVHDGMPEHPKVEPLSDAAFRLLIQSWCWSSRQLSDGFIPAGSWARRGTPKTRRELEAAGLVEPVEGGVYCHDYTEHQRTREEVEDVRSKRAAAGKLGGEAKARAQAEERLLQGFTPPNRVRSRVPTWMRRAVLDRDGMTCQLCGGDVRPEDLHLDHVHPHSKGGPDTVANLQVTHSWCNISKGARVDA